MEILINNEDGSTSKFTEEMAVTAIKEREHLRSELTRASEVKDAYVSRVGNLREQVYNFFNNEYSAGETELTFQVSDINQMLRDIGANTLKTLFTITGTINFTLTDIEAEDEDEARSNAEDSLNLTSNEGDLDWDLDIDEVNEQ